jgi:hypothetical protein
LTFIHQNIYSSITQPSVTWRTDYRLDKPLLLGPADGGNICSDAFQFISGEGSGVILVWRAVPGAGFYIVQWSRNSSFSGPTVRTALVSAPDSSYELSFLTDIRLGAEYFWRVQAYAEDGGVSDTSDTWSFTFECPDLENPFTPQETEPYYQNTPLCTLFNVDLGLGGSKNVECCSQVKYTLAIQWNCLTPEGNSLTIQSIFWSVSGGTGIVIISPQNQDYAIVTVAPRASESFSISACVTLTDGINLYFTCCDSMSVEVDCDSDNKGVVCHYPFPGLIRAIDPLYYVAQTVNSSSWDGEYSVLSQNPDGAYYTCWVGGWVFESYVISNPEDMKMYDIGYDYLCDDGYYQTEASKDTNKGCIGRGRDTILRHETRVPIPIGCGMTVKDGYLDVDWEKILQGSDLSFDPLECRLSGGGGYGYGYFPDLGCGLVLEDNYLYVDTEQLAGPGLEVYESDTCKLAVNVGCGIEIDDYNQVRLKMSFFGAGLAYELSDGEPKCQIYVNPGCGLRVDPATDEIYVYAEDLAGNHLEAVGECALNVKSQEVLLVVGVYCYGGQIYTITDYYHVLDF